MTDKELFLEIIGALDCTGSIGARKAVYKIIHRIQFAESERAATLVRNYGWPKEYADMQLCVSSDILATSPGKGDKR